MSGGHRCPHPKCDRACATEMFSCRRHWYTLPSTMRNRIYAAHRRKDLDATLALYEEARLFWARAEASA